jgi:hypothetical protein
VGITPRWTPAERAPARRDDSYREAARRDARVKTEAAIEAEQQDMERQVPRDARRHYGAATMALC